MWSFLQRLAGIQQISGELFAGRTVLVGGNDELLFSVAADIQSFFQLCGAVAVEVRQHKDLAALGELGVRHLGGHGIHQTFLHLDVGVPGLADVMDSLEEIAISQFDDVDLGNGGHVVLAILAGITDDQSLSFFSVDCSGSSAASSTMLVTSCWKSNLFHPILSPARPVLSPNRSPQYDTKDPDSRLVS